MIEVYIDNEDVTGRLLQLSSIDEWIDIASSVGGVPVMGEVSMELPLIYRLSIESLRQNENVPVKINMTGNAYFIGVIDVSTITYSAAGTVAFTARDSLFLSVSAPALLRSETTFPDLSNPQVIEPNIVTFLSAGVITPLPQNGSVVGLKVAGKWHYACVTNVDDTLFPLVRVYINPYLPTLVAQVIEEWKFFSRDVCGVDILSYFGDFPDKVDGAALVRTLVWSFDFGADIQIEPFFLPLSYAAFSTSFTLPDGTMVGARGFLKQLVQDIGANFYSIAGVYYMTRIGALFTGTASVVLEDVEDFEVKFQWQKSSDAIHVEMKFPDGHMEAKQAEKAQGVEPKNILSRTVNYGLYEAVQPVLDDLTLFYMTPRLFASVTSKLSTLYLFLRCGAMIRFMERDWLVLAKSVDMIGGRVSWELLEA